MLRLNDLYLPDIRSGLQPRQADSNPVPTLSHYQALFVAQGPEQDNDCEPIKQSHPAPRSGTPLTTRACCTGRSGPPPGACSLRPLGQKVGITTKVPEHGRKWDYSWREDHYEMLRDMDLKRVEPMRKIMQKIKINVAGLLLWLDTSNSRHQKIV